MRKLFVIALAASFLTACTGNQMARQWGGTQTVELPAGQKLVVATWKDHDLWYLTEPMDSGYVPKVKNFHESSSWGINQGTVIFNEHR